MINKINCCPAWQLLSCVARHGQSFSGIQQRYLYEEIKKECLDYDTNIKNQKIESITMSNQHENEKRFSALIPFYFNWR